jgi:hypothetical protein
MKFDHCCPKWVELLHRPNDFVGDFGEDSLLSESGSPQRLGEHGEGYSFFVYREIPIDENNLSS